MEIGAAQVVVVVTVSVAVMMAVVVSERFRAMLARLGAGVGRRVPDIEYQHRNPVHNQANDGDDDRPVECDGNRRHQARYAFDRHVERKPGEQQCARVAAQGIDLAGAESKAGIAGMAPAVDVGKDGQAQCDRMGRHVKAVGEQGHRTECEPRHDLDHHGHGGQQGDGKGAPFPPLPPVQTKRVTVFPGCEIRLVHYADSRALPCSSSIPSGSPLPDRMEPMFTSRRGGAATI